MSSQALQRPTPRAELVELALQRLASRLPSEESRRAYRRGWEAWTAWCRGEGLEPLEARALDIEHWLSALSERGLAPKSRALRLQAVRAVYRALIVERVLSVDPTERAKVTRAGQTSKTPWLPLQDLQSLVRVALKDYSWRGRRDAALLILLMGTGIRRAGVARLRVGDFEPGRGIAVTLKGGEVQLFSLPAHAAGSLKLWLEYRRAMADLGASSPLFPAHREGPAPVSPLGVWRALKRLGVRAGIPLALVTPHALRRSYATLLHQSGVPLEKIQAFLGHKSPQMTMRYVKLAQTSGPAPGEAILKDLLGVEEKV